MNDEITIISSQNYIDDDIVTEKIDNNDYEVLISPSFEIDGKFYSVLLDGHHSLAAARASGVEPVIEKATIQDDHNISLLEDGLIDDYLEVHYIDTDWYDIDTGVNVF